MLERGGEGERERGERGREGREVKRVKIDNFIFLSYFSTHCCDPI